MLAMVYNKHIKQHKENLIMTNAQILGEKLYQLRKEKGISQEELAYNLNVSRQAISKWERGEALPDTDNLISLAKLYEVSLDELVGNAVCNSVQDVATTQPTNMVEAESDDATTVICHIQLLLQLHLFCGDVWQRAERVGKLVGRYI